MGGLVIFLLKQLVDLGFYERVGDTNVLTVTKKLQR
jgi:hypothetical protein